MSDAADPRRLPMPVRLLIVLYAILWIGGVVVYVFRGGPDPRDWWTAPAFLALAAVLVTLATPGADRIALAIALLAGFAAEVIGVRTGWPFGRYVYTDALAPGLLGVPLVITLAWVVLVAFVRQALARAGMRGWPAVAAGATAMTLIDLVVDPVASGPAAYWTWLEPGAYYGVPARNFAGWWLVSLCIFAILDRRGPAPPSQGARLVGSSIVVFFALIALPAGLTIAGLIGLAIALADWRIRDRAAVPAGAGAG